MQRVTVSLLHIVLVLLFFSGAVFFLCLPSFPELRLRLAHFLLEESEQCIYVGFAIFGFTFLLFLGVYGSNRGRYLFLEAKGAAPVAIDLTVVQKALDTLFKEHFSERASLEDVALTRRKKLLIGIRIASMEDEEQQALFLSVEERLRKQLLEQFGYTKAFQLAVRSFVGR